MTDWTGEREPTGVTLPLFYISDRCFHPPRSWSLSPVAMTALPLLLLAMSAASVLAEPTVYLREQFEDGGESFWFPGC